MLEPQQDEGWWRSLEELDPMDRCEDCGRSRVEVHADRTGDRVCLNCYERRWASQDTAAAS